MPDFETMDLEQAAVWWPATGVNDNAEPTRGNPTQIECRWEIKRRQTVNAQGQPIALDATAIVVDDVQPGDFLWLGALDDWNSTGSVGDASEVMEVLTYAETPDIKNRFVRKTLGLGYFAGNPPVVT